MGMLVGRADLFKMPGLSREIFCTDLHRLEMAGPCVVRFILCSALLDEQPEPVFSVLMPIASVPSALSRTATFIACQGVRKAGQIAATLM